MQRVTRVFLSVAIASTLVAQGPIIANAKEPAARSNSPLGFLSCEDVSWLKWCK